MKNSVEKELTVDGVTFQHIKTRPHAPVSIYKGKESFLRIGSPDLIRKELELHKQLTSFNFPIPKLLGEGTVEGLSYFIETSLGDQLIGDVFLEDMIQQGYISDEHFQEFLSITERFAKAQLNTQRFENWWEEFYNGSYTDALIQELPHLETRILDAVEKAKARLLALPAVITHNDFNPYNLFKAGVIDMEFAFYAPAGLDIVSNIFTTSFFPKEGDFEYKRTIEFTDTQIDQYLSLFDQIYQQAGIPIPTSRLDDFLIFRAIHASVGMDAFPKLQGWRFGQFEKLLESYLNDQSISQFWRP